MIDYIIENFDIAFILSINAVTYVFIHIIDYLNGRRKVPTYQKHLITLFSMLLLGFIFYINNYDDINKLISSAVIAPFAWSLVIKPMIDKLQIGYSKDKKNNNYGKENCKR